MRTPQLVQVKRGHSKDGVGTHGTSEQVKAAEKAGSEAAPKQPFFSSTLAPLPLCGIVQTPRQRAWWAHFVFADRPLPDCCNHCHYTLLPSCHSLSISCNYIFFFQFVCFTSVFLFRFGSDCICFITAVSSHSVVCCMLTVYWLLHPDHSRCLVNKYMKEWDQGSGWGGAGGGREHILFNHPSDGLPCGTAQLAGEEKIKDSLGSTAQQGWGGRFVRRVVYRMISPR